MVGRFGFAHMKLTIVGLNKVQRCDFNNCYFMLWVGWEVDTCQTNSLCYSLPFWLKSLASAPLLVPQKPLVQWSGAVRYSSKDHLHLRAK